MDKKLKQIADAIKATINAYKEEDGVIRNSEGQPITIFCGLNDESTTTTAFYGKPISMPEIFASYASKIEGVGDPFNTVCLAAIIISIFSKLQNVSLEKCLNQKKL